VSVSYSAQWRMMTLGSTVVFIGRQSTIVMRRRLRAPRSGSALGDLERARTADLRVAGFQLGEGDRVVALEVALGGAVADQLPAAAAAAVVVVGVVVLLGDAARDEAARDIRKVELPERERPQRVEAVGVGGEGEQAGHLQQHGAALSDGGGEQA